MGGQNARYHHRQNQIPLTTGLGGNQRGKASWFIACFTAWTWPWARDAVTSKHSETGRRILPAKISRIASTCFIGRLDRLAQRTLSDLLAVAVRFAQQHGPIFTYATGGYYRPNATNAEYGAELARFLELGYRAVKLKTGAGTVAAEAERIAAVRRAIGDEPLLMLDMNAAYDLPDCIEFARAGRTAPDLLARGAIALVLAARRFCAPLCCDADSAGAWRARVDPLHGTRFHCRGRHPLRSVRRDSRPPGSPRRCASRSWRSSMARWSRPHTAPELHGHLVLASPRCVFGVESHGGPQTDPLAYGLFREHPELRDGHLIIGDSPGFGLDIDWAFVDRYRVQ